MGFPFTIRERGQLKDCCEWAFKGDRFEQGVEALPDGEDSPWQQMLDWSPWIEECLVLLDSDGAFNSFSYPGTYRQQPAFDMDIFQFIRHEFNRLRNEKTKRDIPPKPVVKRLR